MNTKKFKKFAKTEIEGLIQSAETRLNIIRDTMKLCKSKCKECFYPCLLCKNHEDSDEWEDDHQCYQVNHSCKVLCTYCSKNGKNLICGDKSGHSGKHNCRKENHTCGELCSLAKFGGCQEKCNEESGHDKTKIPCKCNAETHYCKAKCSVPICKNTCKMPYNAKNHQHICIQTTCPYKCQVKIWNDSLKMVTNCGRDCSCNNHAHHIVDKDNDQKININEQHICELQHPCSAKCNELGNCSVDIKRKIIEKEILITGAGSKIQYDAYAEVNAQKKRCCTKIPIGKFKHSGTDHRCYEGDAKDHIHTCDIKCGSCGYYCQEKYGHRDDKGSLHDCVHGNMRNTIFYATQDIVDTGGGRSYKVGDTGVAEMCNIFCDRLGRGHIHLELCQYAATNKSCIAEPGRRHQIKEYKPFPKKQKDEVKHGKFWKRKQWKDPCVGKDFDKCNFVCQHPSHKEKEKKTDDDEPFIDETKYCTGLLWHKPCSTATKHSFKCSHPFSNAHVIFICDISGSMGATDGAQSKPQHAFIKNAGRLDNRLGALYSAIHKFLEIRLNKGCKDMVSAVMTPGHPSAKAAVRVTADKNFISTYLLKYKPYGGENYGQAFRDAKSIINTSEETVVIFLTDGYSGDYGAMAIAKGLRTTMNTKFQLFCITLGPNQTASNTTVKNICFAASGKMLKALSGNELGTTFTQIAKQMNSGSFMRKY